MKNSVTLELIQFNHPRKGLILIEQGPTTDEETLALLIDILPDSPPDIQKRIRKIIACSRDQETQSLKIIR